MIITEKLMFELVLIFDKEQFEIMKQSIESKLIYTLSLKTRRTAEMRSQNHQKYIEYLIHPESRSMHDLDADELNNMKGMSMIIDKITEIVNQMKRHAEPQEVRNPPRRNARAYSMKLRKRDAKS